MTEGVRSAVILALALSLLVLGVWEPVRAGPFPSLSLSFNADAGEYANAVRAADNNDLLYPRLAIDRSPASSHNGTLYVLGLSNLTCASIVTVRSHDLGRTFEAPHVASGQCLRGPTLDVVTGGDGTLYVATWGPQVLRSVDEGETWEMLATLGNTSSPTSLALDPAGRLYAAWGTDAAPYPAGPVYVSTSGDGGRNWTVPKDILQPGTEGSYPQIAASGTQAVVVFIANVSRIPFVAAVSSIDGGITWGEGNPMSTPFPCARWAAPSIAASRLGTFAISMSVNVAVPQAGCWDDWGNGTRTCAALFRDFGNVTLWNTGGPGWPAVGYGDAVVFDDASRAHVTWHSIARNWTGAHVYVASGNATDGGFSTGSFSTVLGVYGGNSTAQENIAAGPAGTVFLVWEVVNYSNPQDSRAGIYVRGVSGEIVGEVSGPAFVPPLDVELRNPATGEVQERASWTGAPIELPAVRPGRYEMWLASGSNRTMAGTLPVRAFGRTTFAVTAEGSPVPGGPSWALVAAVASIGGASVAGAWFWRRRRDQT